MSYYNLYAPMTYNSKRQYFENYLPPRSSCIQRAILEMR